jgi:hypothetical protein
MRYLEQLAQLINNFTDRANIYEGKPHKNGEYKGLDNNQGNYFYTYESGDVVRGVSYTSCVNMVQEVTLVVQTNCFTNELQFNKWLNVALKNSDDVQDVIASYTDKYRIMREETGAEYESDLLFAKIRFNWRYNDCYECDLVDVAPICAPLRLTFQDNEFEVINEPCGKSFDLTCDTLINGVVFATTAPVDFGGVYLPSGTLNGRNTYQHKTLTCKTIRYDFDAGFGGFLWIAECAISGNILYSDFPNDAMFPWGFLWQGEDLTSQATVSDACCNGGSTEPATWELRDTDGTVLQTGSIAAGGSAVIIAPDATVENSNQTFQEAIVSNGVEVLNDYEFEFQDENGNVLNTEFRPAMIGETFIVGAGGACPTTFSYDLYINGVFSQTVTIDVTQDINITT